MKIKGETIRMQDCDVALHQDLRKELSDAVVVSSDMELEGESMDTNSGFKMNRRNGGYQSHLDRYRMPFDLIPSCSGILRGEKSMSRIERYYGIQKTVREGSYIQEWANGPSNTKLMIMYESLRRSKLESKGRTGEKYWATVERLFRMEEY